MNLCRGDLVMSVHIEEARSDTVTTQTFTNDVTYSTTAIDEPSDILRKLSVGMLYKLRMTFGML
jgi:hypothetical protein